jgi:hypothetical protein
MNFEEYQQSSPEEQTKEKGLGKSYSEKATVNGVEISVRWDREYEDYTIYFPQIELGEKASEKGVFDQIIRITRRPEVAKQVFDYASKLAQTESDVYKIFKQVEDFSRDLPYNEDEE